MSAVRNFLKRKFDYLTERQIEAIMQTECQYYDDFGQKTADDNLADILSREHYAHLIRKAPTRSEIQAAREAEWMADRGTKRVPAEVRIEIAREIARIGEDPDTLLDAIPYEAQRNAQVKEHQSAVAQLERRVAQTERSEENEWLKETLGIDASILLPSQRRKYLAERQKQQNPRALQRSALAVDLAAGRDPATMTARERLALHRATESLKQGAR